MLPRAVFYIAVLLSMLCLVPTHAADLQQGLEAYQRGDYATALSEFEPLAEQGDPVAQFSLGVMYDNGEGVIQDYEQAFNWFRQAAEQGHARAQGHLGRMYFLGRGTEEDLVQAYIWFDLAVAQGDDRFGLSQKSRRLAEEKMTPTELQQAQEQSREYMARYVAPFQQGSTPTPAIAANGTPSDTASAPNTPDAAISPEPSSEDTPTPPARDSVASNNNTPVSPPTLMSTATPEPMNASSGSSETTPLAIPPLPSPGTPSPGTPSPGTPSPGTPQSPSTPSTTDNTPSSIATTTNIAESEAPESPEDQTDTTTATTPPTVEPPPTAALSQPATLQAPPTTVAPTMTTPSTGFPRTGTSTPSTPGGTTAPDNTDAVADNASDDTEITEAATEVATASPPAATPARRQTPRIRTPIRPSPEGRFRVQLASLSSSDQANAEGNRLQQRHPQLLGQLTLTVQSANLEQGVVHRVQVGPLSYGTANSLCRELKRNHQPCLVVNR